MKPHCRKQQSRLWPPARRGRRGLVLIAALVCLLIVTSIIATMLQSALRAHRQLRAERDRRQVELLVEAGADRAAGRIDSEPDFRGDTWNFPAEAIVGSGAGRVTTDVSVAADGENWQIHVVAEYPLDRGFPVRRSHTFTVRTLSTLTQEQSP